MPDDLPEGTEVKVYDSEVRHQNDDEGDDDNDYIQVVENVTRNREESQNNNVTPLSILTSTRIFDENGNEVEESPTWSKPTLKLDGKNVFVLDIKSVRYEYKRREVFRYRHVKDES